VGKVETLKSRLGERGFRFDSWDAFLADRATALPIVEAIVARGLPDGLRDLDQPVDAEGEDIARFQTLMASSGVVPFSGSFLTGAIGPAVTSAVGDGEGNVVAVAHGYMPHNAHSPYRSHAWGGLVAVSEAQRGKGLGSYINARMILSAFRDLGATHVYELVSASNIASRRMVASCGLRPEPSLICGIAVPSEGGRFTR